MARSGVHPNKEVRKALKDMRKAGWTIETAAGGHSHRWGRAVCPHWHVDDSGRRYRCTRGIDSTPRNAGNHAKRIRRALRRCQELLAQFGNEEQSDA